MSELDDMIDIAYDELTGTDYESSVAEASAELELLREAAFEWAQREANRLGGAQLCGGCYDPPRGKVHWPKCRVLRILRTDPERAKRMGLEWAL